MRLSSIILTELSAEKLKAEEKLERLINGKGDIDETTAEIKELLGEIVLIDQKLTKWQGYIQPSKDNNNDNNNE